MAQMRTELGLVLKHVTRVQKRLMQSTTWLNHQVPKALNRRISAKVGTIVTTIVRVIMSEMETTIATTTSTGVAMVTETTEMDLMFLLKIVKLLLGMVEEVCRELRICCIK